MPLCRSLTQLVFEALARFERRILVGRNLDLLRISRFDTRAGAALPNLESAKGRVMELPEVNMIRFHPLQARVDVPEQVVTRPYVGRVVVITGVYDRAAAFGGEVVVVSALADEPPDVLLAQTVVVGGVDKVDSDVAHGVEDAVSLGIGHRSSIPDSEAAGVLEHQPDRSDDVAAYHGRQRNLTDLERDIGRKGGDML